MKLIFFYLDLRILYIKIKSKCFCLNANVNKTIYYYIVSNVDYYYAHNVVNNIPM